MKKLILFLGIMCMGFQCDDELKPMENYGVWVVKNNTPHALMIKPGVNSLQPYELAAGASVQFYSGSYEIVKMPDFRSLLDHNAWRGFAENNIYFEVLSDDGSPLTRWNYVDRDSAGRQFFNESSWTNTSSPGERDDEIKIIWRFEITQEDIQ